MYATADALFDGPGPSRAALRSIDWARTPLGPVDAWPIDLRCAARSLAMVAAPMLVWWGDEYIQMHNDALIESLGDEPAVGRPAVDCWPERWEVLEPSASAVYKTGGELHLDDVVLPIDGAPTSYWTLSLAPIKNDEGRVRGVVASACDLTERINAHEHERRSADETTANLQIALASNRRIGIAIGILMGLRRITDTAAFDLLRSASQRGHRKLREVAEDVVLTGDLPD